MAAGRFAYGAYTAARTRSMAIAATIHAAAANSIVHTGSPGKNAFISDPIAVATSSCGTTMKMLNNPM